MRWESHQAFAERFTPYGLNPAALATCYAMAENVFAVTQGGLDTPVLLDEIDREALQVERVARPAIPEQPSIKMLSAGKAIPDCAVKVVDDTGNALPDRIIGELALRSTYMLTGYYNRPDATEKAMRDGWYLTGDLGYMVNGEVFISGRKKDLIIVGGKNVYPQDLERLAMEVHGVHPGRVVAFGIYNEAAGTEEVVIVAEADETDEDARNRIADEIRQSVTRGSAIALRHAHIVDAGWILKTSSGKDRPPGQPREIPEGNGNGRRMILYYIRHGQSANNALWDSSGSSEGRSDDPPLTPVGEAQAQHVAKWLASLPEPPAEPSPFRFAPQPHLLLPDETSCADRFCHCQYIEFAPAGLGGSA